MTPIALYPSLGSLKKTAGFGAGIVFVSYQFLTWSPDMNGAVPAAIAGIGLFMIAQAGVRYLKPTPSFAADEDGFSVMGKKKRGWDEFRGTSIHTARVGIFPAARWVVISTGKSILGRKAHIKWTHLSAPARDMAAEIEAYAVHAKRKLDLTHALADVPDSAPVQQVAGPRRSSPQPVVTLANAAGGGPVQSVPSFGERLFGRRKVL